MLSKVEFNKQNTSRLSFTLMNTDLVTHLILAVDRKITEAITIVELAPITFEPVTDYHWL